MLKSFLPDASQPSSASISLQASTDPTSGKESIRVLIIGSRQGITSIIHTLHRLGFAEVGEWSPPLPTGNSGQMMSILTRYILLN